MEIFYGLLLFPILLLWNIAYLFFRIYYPMYILKKGMCLYYSDSIYFVTSIERKGLLLGSISDEHGRSLSGDSIYEFAIMKKYKILGKNLEEAKENFPEYFV